MTRYLRCVFAMGSVVLTRCRVKLEHSIVFVRPQVLQVTVCAAFQGLLQHAEALREGDRVRSTISQLQRTSQGSNWSVRRC
jgi:alpha-D-ribose 1-methylphosphonate 5-triphosphate synthase subunit PhnG